MSFKSKFRISSLLLFVLIIFVYLPLLVYNFINNNLGSGFFTILYLVLYVFTFFIVLNLFITSYCKIKIEDNNVSIYTLGYFKINKVSYDLIDVLNINIKVNSTKVTSMDKSTVVKYRIRKDKEYEIKLNTFLQFKEEDILSLKKTLKDLKKNK